MRCEEVVDTSKEKADYHSLIGHIVSTASSVFTVLWSVIYTVFLDMGYLGIIGTMRSLNFDKLTLCDGCRCALLLTLQMQDTCPSPRELN